MGPESLPTIHTMFLDQKIPVFRDDICCKIICGYDRPGNQMSPEHVLPLPLIVKQYLTCIENDLSAKVSTKDKKRLKAGTETGLCWQMVNGLKVNVLEQTLETTGSSYILARNLN
jgi:hypothetical protein